MAKAKYEIGAWAARFLLDRLNSDVPIAPRRQIIPCRLVVRGSAAPPPTAGLSTFFGYFGNVPIELDMPDDRSKQ